MGKTYYCQVYFNWLYTKTSGDVGDYGQWFIELGSFGMLKDGYVQRFPTKGLIKVRKNSELKMEKPTLVYSTVRDEKKETFKVTIKIQEYDVASNDVMLEKDLTFPLVNGVPQIVEIKSKNEKVTANFTVHVQEKAGW